jgi:hypothetical protein
MKDVSFPVRGIKEETIRVLTERAPELVAEPDSEDPEMKWRRNREIGEVLTRYLQGADFRYTLDLRDFIQDREADPILLFLQRYRFGHCELFASALTAMCQSVGVESRMVSGYVAVEYDSSLQHYVVRESNAHAWVEIRTGPWQWRQFDPTTQEVLETLQADRRSWADDWRWLYDQADFLWNSRFVTFDGSSQATLADRFSGQIGSTLRDGFDWVGNKAQRVNRSFLLGPAGYIWLGVVAVAVVIAIIAIVFAIRRRRRLSRVLSLEGGVQIRQMLGAGFYMDLLDAFDQIGAPKPANVPPMNHLPVVRKVRPEIAEAAEPLLRLFYEVRFGQRMLAREERRQAEDAAKDLLRSTRHSGKKAS